MQKLVNKKWVNTIKADLVDGDRIKEFVGGGSIETVYMTPVVEVPVRLVSMADFGELLPDAVIIELTDFQNTTTINAGKRQAAARILMRIYSNVKVDVLDAKFTTLLTNLVTHTSLTAGQATKIMNKLT